MQLGTILEKIFLCLKFVFKNRFYFFVIFIMSASYAYRIRKSFILKHLPLFVTNKDIDMSVSFFDFDFNTMNAILNSTMGKIRYMPSNVLLPSNKKDANRCEREMFLHAQKRMFELLSGANKISISKEYVRDGVVFGKMIIDNKDIAWILIHEHLGHDLTRGALENTSSWCQMLSIHDGNENFKKISKDQNV